MIKFIKIFIIQWKYYPKMVAYFKYRYEIQYEQSRFKYSLRMAISGVRTYRTSVENGVEDSWKSIYLEEPVIENQCERCQHFLRFTIEEIDFKFNLCSFSKLGGYRKCSTFKEGECSNVKIVNT